MLSAKGVYYDIVIAGTGCAGLWTALHLSEKAQSDLSILLVDKDLKEKNDRTWCFWDAIDTNEKLPLDFSWSRLKFVSDSFVKIQELKQHYKMLRSQSFYKWAFHKLSKQANIHFKKARIKSFIEETDIVELVTDEGIIYAGHVFNSCFDSRTLKLLSDSPHFLFQQFKGWYIECEENKFNTDSFTLMDFSISQKDAVSFCYVLPLSPKKALIEYTAITPQLLESVDLSAALLDYIQINLNIQKFRIEEEENGLIPMANIVDNSTEKVTQIGTNAGWVKSSTGYAFKNIRNRSKQVVESYLTGTPTVNLPAVKNRFKFYDKLLLYILHQNPEKGKEVFQKLFRKNSYDRILKFLDEKSTLLDEMILFMKLPKMLFLSAVYDLYFKPTKTTKKEMKLTTKQILNSVR